MHDIRLEDLVRQTLRDEASTLPFSISTEMLERRLAVRRRARDKGRWFAAAAVAIFAVTTTAAILAWSASDDAKVAATPSPSTTVRSLPTPAEMLSGYPEAVVLLEQSVGSADGPTSAAPAGSPTPLEIGTVSFDGPFVIAIACLGGGDMLAEVSTPNLDIVYTRAIAVCDGTPTYSEYAAPPIDPGSTGDAVTVTVPAGRSWRLAIGTLPSSLVEPPALENIGLTSDWALLSDLPATQVTAAAPRTGARLALPVGVTRVGVFIQCKGVGTLSVTFGSEPASTSPCDPVGATHRLEFPAVGGEVASLELTSDRPGVWVRMVVETNGRITTVYPSAPPLPAALSAAPYVAPDANVVGFGTIGSSEQRILKAAGARPGRPTGTSSPSRSRTSPLAPPSTSCRSRVARSFARSSPSRHRPSSSTVGQTTHTDRSTTGSRRKRSSSSAESRWTARTTESSRRWLGEGQLGFTADLALDGSVFVVDACHAGSGCVRTMVDTETAIARTFERAADPLCRILGIADGVIIATTRATCSEEAVTALVAVTDDGEPRVLLEDAPPEIAGAVVVRTAEGLKVLYVGAVADDGSAVTLALIDVATGTTTDLPPSDIGDPRLAPYREAVIDGWVLLAGGVMGDFPWQRAIDRPIPVLLDVVTGERIELVNLPHWTGNLTN